ncbi:MAG: hypothetical protein AABX73_01680 [Nanoarchaeota archaeon]
MDNKNIIIIALVTALLIPNIQALGISSPYWEGNPLEMQPGQTKEISFALTNSIKEETDARAIISLTEGSEIAEIVGNKEYLIPVGSSNQKVNLKITIPKESQIGATYNVKLSLSSVPENKTANIQIGLNYDVSFPVKIVAESPQKTEDITQTGEKPRNVILIISIILLLLAVIILIVYLISKRKNNKYLNSKQTPAK